VPTLSEVKLPTGKPDAGEPHVRFGGRGGRVNNRSSLPLSSAIDPVRWDEIGNLDEAVDLANEYENSESNRIFLFLAEKSITRADRKKFIKTIIWRD